MSISVRVRFIGIFRELSGRGQFLMKLEEPTTLRRAIQKLVEFFSSEFKRALVDPELDDPRPNALILVNGREISVLEALETMIYEGDEVLFIPVLHGG